MRFYLIVFLLLFSSLYYGTQYITTEEFQVYADNSKAEWTCYVNKFVGEFYLMFSKYDQAMSMYTRMQKRCPKGKLGETAAYRIAYCWDQMGYTDRAIAEYEKFIEDYPKSERARKLPMRIQRLESAK